MTRDQGDRNKPLSRVPQHKGLALGSGPCQLSMPRRDPETAPDAAQAAEPADNSPWEAPTVPGHRAARATGTVSSDDGLLRQDLIAEIRRGLECVDLDTLEDVRNLLVGTRQNKSEPVETSP
jgi:hypothetical protein